MKNTLRLLLGALSFISSAASTASPIDVDGMICLRNVGTQTYLALGANHQTQLSEAGMSITLSQPTGNGSDAARCFVLQSADGAVVAAQYTGLTLEGAGRYSEWTMSPVAGQANYYRVACRAKDSNALAYAIYDEVSHSVQTQPLRPADSFSHGLWELLSPEEAKAVLLNVVLHEDADYAMPGEADEYTVYLKRTLQAGVMNSLCLPFAISLEQASQVWGQGTKLYEVFDNSGGSILFRTVQRVEAGVPCVVKPAKVDLLQTLPADVAESINNSTASDVYYVFTGVTEMVEEPQDYVQALAFKGSFCKVVVPAQSYVFSGGAMYHTVSDLSMKPYRSYLQDVQHNVAAYTFAVDDDWATSIDVVEEASLQDGAIYNLQGQSVLHDGQSAHQLQKGIYIVRGKKVVRP